VDAFTENVPAYVREKGMSYTVLLDPDETAQNAYGMRGLPTAVLIDRKGVIVDRWTGYHEEIERQIKTAVKKTLSEPAS